ncbi:hypothetical protein AN191_16760 [Loktanella sp. 5RATIMAR09]|nr:hypothetical protein AN191_16760 [Loktanella sp. 5RATIMAR09]
MTLIGEIAVFLSDHWWHSRAGRRLGSHSAEGHDATAPLPDKGDDGVALIAPATGKFTSKAFVLDKVGKGELPTTGRDSGWAGNEGLAQRFENLPE